MGLFKTAHIVNRADKISNFTVSTAEYGSCNGAAGNNADQR